MSKRSPFNGFIMAFILIACNNVSRDKSVKSPPAENISPGKELVFDRLVGVWKLDGKNLFERWAKLDTNRFHSLVYTITNNDTVKLESATIFLKDDNWIFENAVRDQNQGKAIQFVSSSISINSIQFSNTAHDFPQHVNYSLLNDSTLHAFIAGPHDKGGIDTVRYNYHKYFK